MVVATKLLDYAKHLHRSGRPAEAEAAYRSVLGVEPDNAEALHFLGLLKYREGQGAAAVELMSRALVLRPDWPELHCTLGGILSANAERADDGLKLLVRAIELRPDYAEAYMSLGCALDRAGRAEDARAAWARAVELRPAYSQAVQPSNPDRKSTPTIDQDMFFKLFRRPWRVESHVSGLITSVELAALVALIQAFHCTRLAEFGVGTGANAATVLRHCPAVKSYIGVDVPPGSIPSLPFQVREVPLEAGALALGDSRFKLLVREGGTLHTTPEELGPLDFVFIDGDHGPDAVRHDTGLARQVVKQGVICWHDYGNPPAIGPTRVIDELNRVEGGHICRLGETFLCFEIR